MTGQSAAQSWFEAIANTAIGFGVSMAANLIILPMCGITISLRQDLFSTCGFTVISIARSYLLRRAFNWLHVRQAQPFLPAKYQAPACKKFADELCSHERACRETCIWNGGE